jgi:hypothetical protein
MADTYVAIVSAGRPGNVPAMEAHCQGLAPTWWVPADQVGDYRYCGAERVQAGDGLCEARNLAADAADGRPHVQLSDDLRHVALAHGPERANVVRITLAEAVRVLADAAAATGAQLAGCAPTANPYFSRRRVHATGFVVGDLVWVAGGCPLRWDTTLALKEDYDYTCQHLAAYGKVARCDWLLATFAHRTNRGGAVAYRTPELEDATIAQLIHRWPQAVRPNARRPHEVLLRWPASR